VERAFPFRALVAYRASGLSFRTTFLHDHARDCMTLVIALGYFSSFFTAVHFALSKLIY
jgi:hypothetical protein